MKRRLFRLTNGIICFLHNFLIVYFSLRIQVQEKFMLGISEEDAIKHLEVLLNDTSYLTLMFDKVHTLAQYLRE